MSQQLGEWARLVEPIANKFDLAAKFGQKCIYEGEGADAVAKLLRRMARALDTGKDE